MTIGRHVANIIHYYLQDSVIYLCTRDTVNPVYNPLADLVGIYVEKL